MKLTLILVISSILAYGSADKEEVLENPTLKTLSGALSSWSLYSTFTYKGGSLDKPLSSERPNITKAAEEPGLTSLSGVVGIKYRLSKKDNLSIQVGTYMTAPFHTNYDGNSSRNEEDFNNNNGRLDLDDPVISYFRTYYVGSIQNISFFKYQHSTRGIYTDYGYDSAFAFSQASAIPLGKKVYLAGTFTYTQFFFDKSSTEHPLLGKTSLYPYQKEREYKLSLAMEYYLNPKFALRAITDLGVYFQMRGDELDDLDHQPLQQTIAMTYFINRDISIAPNLRFIAENIRSDRTNVGLSLNVNI